MKNIYSRLAQSIILLSSMTLFSFGQEIETHAQSGPVLKVQHKATTLTQKQCINRAFTILRENKNTTKVQNDSSVITAYAETTTITITCLGSYKLVVFNAAGKDRENVNKWVNWMANNF